MLDAFRVCAAALLAALATTLACPLGARAAPGMEVAVQDDHVFLDQWYFGRESALLEARRLGVTRLRVNLPWARVVARPGARRAPARPSYDWSLYDSLAADAARDGIGLQVTLSGPAPAWATADRLVGVRAVKARAFARFARDAAEHFRGRVDRYAIWNEPNHHAWLAPSASCRKGRWKDGCDERLGALYRALYSAGYAAVKTADPAAAVLFGELAPQQLSAPRRPSAYATAPLRLLRAVTCSTRAYKARRRCPRLLTDGFAHHPYAFLTAPNRVTGGPDDVTLATLGRLTRALDKLARRRALTTPTGGAPELYLTEYGYLQSGKRKLPEATRATYLTRSFSMALANPRVRQLVQYLLVAPPPPDRDLFPTHIINHDGSATPSFTALERWAEANARRLAG